MSPWTGETGYVQDLWGRHPLSARWSFPPAPEHTHIFLCGNPAMIDTMAEILAAEGFIEHTKKTPGQLHLERYW